MHKTIHDVIEKNRRIGRGYSEQGAPRLFTEQEFFDISMELGWNQLDAGYRRLHEKLALWIKGNLSVATALEIGCGPGYLTYCLNALGVACTGIDGNPYSKNLFDQLHGPFSSAFVLDKGFDNLYSEVDVVISIEAFEHIPDADLNKILSKVRQQIRPKFIVFSSTPYQDPNPEWDIQWGHINLKQPNEWHTLFKSFGYALSVLKPPVTEWASLYVSEQV